MSGVVVGSLSIDGFYCRWFFYGFSGFPPWEKINPKIVHGQIWTEEQETAFENIKKLVTDAPVLSYYNPESAYEYKSYKLCLMQDRQRLI